MATAGTSACEESGLAARIRLPIETERLHMLRAASDAGFNRVTAQTAPNNAAALAVLRRIGFRIEGETEWEGRAMAFGVCELSGQPVETRA